MRQLREALSTLPETLDETYGRILLKIEKHHKPYAVRILQLLAYSERPLRIEEIADAVVVDPHGIPTFNSDLRMPRPEEIAITCSSLVSVVRTQQTERYFKFDKEGLELRLAHFSVKEYLRSINVEENFHQSFVELHARKEIASICIAYMDYVNTERPDTARGDHLVQVQKDFPFLHYSASNWMKNANFALSDEYVRQAATDLLLDKKGTFTLSLWIHSPEDDHWLNDFDEDPAWPLYYASLLGLTNVIHLLLAHGLDPNAQVGIRGSALQAAVYHAQIDAAKILLEYGTSPLYWACSKGSSLLANTPSAHGADVNALNRCDQGSETALHVAIKECHEDNTKLLLGSGADVDIQGPQDSPLYIACTIQNEFLVERLLLEHDANPLMRGERHNDALQVAVERNNT